MQQQNSEVLSALCNSDCASVSVVQEGWCICMTTITKHRVSIKAGLYIAKVPSPAHVQASKEDLQYLKTGNRVGRNDQCTRTLAYFSPSWPVHQEYVA